MAEQAAEDAAALCKAKLDTSSKAKERAHSDSLDLLQDPLPTAPPYEADSQTIVVDWVADVEPTVHTHDGNLMILQHCEWHGAEAIKKKLIKKGYKKERRDKVVDLLWKWIKAADLDLLDLSRDNIILAL